MIDHHFNELVRNVREITVVFYVTLTLSVYVLKYIHTYIHHLSKTLKVLYQGILSSTCAIIFTIYQYHYALNFTTVSAEYHEMSPVK